jgi:hypothetical protein
MQEKVQESLRQAYVAMEENREVNVERSKINYDRKVTATNFEIEDLVWVLDPAIKPGESKKFTRKWKGPYKILSCINDVNYYIKPVVGNGKKLVIHRNRLKKCYTNEVYRVDTDTPALDPSDVAPPEEDRRLITLREPQFIEEVMVPQMEAEPPTMQDEQVPIVAQDDLFGEILGTLDATEPIPLDVSFQ